MKKLLASVSFAVVAAVFAGCASSGGHHAAHWGYGADNGPSKWGEFGFETCKVGQAQSPIDVLSKGAKSVKNELKVSYKANSKDLVNNGHTVQVNFNEGSSLNFGGKTYKLVQTHFHTPSENWIDGKSYPLEAHLVHKADDGSLLVLGVLFEKGAANAELNKVATSAPKEADNSVNLANFDPNKLLPKNRGYYAFSGSLTTPPCSENVQWVVLSAKVSASEKQIADLNAIMKENARPTQPLNGRTIKVAK